MVKHYKHCNFKKTDYLLDAKSSRVSRTSSTLLLSTVESHVSGTNVNNTLEKVDLGFS